MFFVKPKDGAQRLADLLVYFWLNKKTIYLTKNAILVPESSKILKVQKWCQNGSTAIILGVMRNFRKNRILIAIFRQKVSPKIVCTRLFLRAQKYKKVD